LTALYDTANRPGGFNKEIRIFSNDPKTPEKVVVIDGVVKPRPMPMIGVEPAFMNLGKVKINEERLLKVAVSNMGEKELELYSISSRDGSIKLLDKEMRIAPGEKVDLELSYKRTAAGSFREVFLVMSNARRATVSLVVTGETE
ncbi:MAG: DUF1573 domain-containing protein, partial [Nitrospirota bacterium]|nr:DUF1573 domain-containing protein [Nitrospirota bacterium]